MDSRRLRRSTIICSVLTALLVGVTTTPTLTQSTSAADGPWSGWAQCVLKTTAANYEETQTHTWRITGGPPRVTGSTRHWPAVWNVQGTGQPALADHTTAWWIALDTGAVTSSASPAGLITLSDQGGIAGEEIAGLAGGDV